MCRERKCNISVFKLVLAITFLVAGVFDRTGLGGQEVSVQKPKTNVILITISTLRADHVGCLGYDRDTTPNFDRFGKDNILFENAFASSSWTLPNHVSIFTSLYPSVHGATHVSRTLRTEHYTLAEILGDSGYRCVGFGCNPRLNEKYGFAQGFDFYDDYSASMILDSLGFGNEERININKQRTNDLINDAAIRWLQKNTVEPFFMFLHYYDNHWDYLPSVPYNSLYDPNYKGPIDGTQISREPLFSNPPTKEDIEHIIALYDGEVRQTDNDLGEMLEFLREKGLLDNSIVIIAGDHGEQFYEHGNTSHHGVFDELIHVPLAISLPSKAGKEQRITSLVSQVDILPTILDYLEIPVPAECQGKSVKPVIDGRMEAVNDFVFSEYTGGAVANCYAIRSNRYKYCEGNGEPFAYDLLEDVVEQKEILSADFTEDVKVLQQRLREYSADIVSTNHSNSAGTTTLSRGHRIILKRGFHIGAWVLKQQKLDQDRFWESGFTFVDIWGSTHPDFLGDPPGIPWARGTGFPFLVECELPYLPNLITLKWRDEDFVDREPCLSQVSEWMAKARVLYPDVLLQTIQFNGQFELKGLQTFMERAKPDILEFDMYSYGSNLDEYGLKSIYEELEKYRYAASRGNDWSRSINAEPIPWSLVLEGFDRVGSDERDSYIKSESHLRHNQFAAWTFGAKFAQWWLYNSGSGYRNQGYDSLLFHDFDYDNPKPKFYEVAENNRQSRNLGPALIRLKSTSVRFVPGEQIGGDSWIGDDNKWGEQEGNSNSHQVPYLIQKNSENVNLNPLTLSIELPNSNYDIAMYGVVWRGGRNGGGGEKVITASAEGVNFSYSRWNKFRDKEHPEVLLVKGLPVTDGSLDITLGNAYTHGNSPGHWFSFEGFKLTRTDDPSSSRIVHYTDFSLSYDPPGRGRAVAENAPPKNVPLWDSKADPYITNISARNLGLMNDGLKGDVLVGYFVPLLESFDGQEYEGEVYFMILNGLIDPFASAALTKQQIHMEFDFAGSTISSLQRLSRDTGQVEVIPLTHDSGSIYHLDFVLDGGTADLFKFNTGAAFVVKGSLP